MQDLALTVNEAQAEHCVYLMTFTMCNRHPLIIIIINFIYNHMTYLSMNSAGMGPSSSWLFLVMTMSVRVHCRISEDSTPAPLPEPAVRVNETLTGLFEYFWAIDPAHKNIGFFFSCGQIGGWGTPQVWNKCGCNTPSACTDCYRWWDAVTLESVATHGIYTGRRDFSNIADVMLAHSPYNHRWNATAICTFMDDFTWYSIAYLRVYEWLKVTPNSFIYIFTAVNVHYPFFLLIGA